MANGSKVSRDGRPIRVTRIGDSIVIQIADGIGQPRMSEATPGVWIERDAAGSVTAIELLLDALGSVEAESDLEARQNSERSENFLNPL